MFNTNRTLFCAFALIALAASAHADSIIRTGVDGSLSVLAPGASDPSWTISTDGGNTFSAAKVNFPAQICCSMETVSSSAAWVTDPSVVDGNANTGWGVGNTVFLRRGFDLTGFDLSTVAFAGNWRVADLRLGIFLNGVLIDAATADGSYAWTDDQAFSVAIGSPLFVAGINTLELRASSLNSTWDGFWLDGTVTGRTFDQVPEPGSLTLIGSGLAGVLLLARRRKS